MKKTRVIALFMSMILCLSSFGISYANEEITSPYIQNDINDTGDIIYSGTRPAGDNITWSFNDSTKTLTFTGKGFINDCASSTMTDWYPLRYEIENIVIGDGIKYIGRENFAQLENLKRVSLPESLGNISVYAFMHCKNLEDIVLPEGLLCIGTHAFYGCESIKIFNIPSTLVEIGDYALYGMISLEKFVVHPDNKYFSDDKSGVLFSKNKDVLICYPQNRGADSYIIPASVKRIEEISFADAKKLTDISFEKNSCIEEICNSAFSNCKGLAEISLPEGLRVIGADAFLGCEKISAINLPHSLSCISPRSFYLTGLSEISIPENVKEIGDEAFAFTKLTSVTIPEGVEKLGKNLFIYCKNLRSVNIPSTVNSITYDHEGTFSGTDNLEKITVSPDSQYFASDEHGVLYNREKTKLMHFPRKTKVTEYSVPDGVTELCYGTFLGATQLKKVTLPEGIVNIPYAAFMRCENLESVNIPASVTWIGNDAFHFCHNLSYSFPENSSLMNIGRSAFSYNRVTKEIILPESVMSIGDQAFSFNTALVSVTVPENSKLGEGIGQNAFVGCDRMTFYVPKGSETEKHARRTGIPLEMTVLLDGNKLSFDRMPVISNGRTMVPVRAVFEALGGTVDYNSITKTVTANVLNKSVVMTVGTEKFTVDGTEYPLDAPAIILADRTLVPIRALCEALSFAVEWNDVDRIVTINTK